MKLFLDGPRPAFAYSRALLRRRAAAVKAALPAGSSLCYAVKANSHPDVVATLAQVCDGLEVASGGELDLAVATGTGLIVFGGPGKTDDELRAAVTARAIVNVESLHELRRLGHLAAGRDVRVCLRVNRAGTGIDGSHRMTGVPTQFGLDETDLAEAVVLAGALGLPVLGFHLHAVSNSLDGHAYAAHVRDAVDWSLRTAAALGVDLRLVNVGGGFGIDYTGGATFDLSALSAIRSPVPLLFEPGRYLAGPAGWYAADVIDVKRSQGRWFAVLRGGTHHFRLPAAWGYSHPFTILPVEHWPHLYPRPQVLDAPVDVAGELCTPRDILARGVHVDRLRAGDVLVFANAGAYGWDISHKDFLRHQHPRITCF